MDRIPWKTSLVDINSDRTLYAQAQHTNNPFSQPFTASPGHEAMPMDLCISRAIALLDKTLGMDDVRAHLQCYHTPRP